MNAPNAVCRSCGHSTPQEGVNVGTVPLGRPISQSELKTSPPWSAPLIYVVCNYCGLFQKEGHIPYDQIELENYYLSAPSRLVSQHNHEFVEFCSTNFEISPDSPILEIGCGDGGLLREFSKAGYNTLYGVDCALHENQDYSCELFPSFFDQSVVATFAERNIRPKLIILNYVLCVVHGLTEFMTNLEKLVGDHTTVIIETGYVCDLLNKSRIDQFAHMREVVFSLKPLSYLFERHNLFCVDGRCLEDYRGGTLRLMFKQGSSSGLTPALQQIAQRETTFFNTASVQSLNKHFSTTRSILINKLRDLVQTTMPVYGYGGGMKASTLVNWLGLSSNQIHKTIDIDPVKHGKYLPTAGIEICSLRSLLTEVSKPIAVVNLALDHTEEVQELLKKELPSGSLIVHLLPDFETVPVQALTMSRDTLLGSTSS